MSVVYALTAAASFGILAIAATRGLRNNSLITALLVSLPVGAVVTGLFTLFDWPPEISAWGVGVFVLAGIIGEGVGRTAFIAAVERLGPSTATPLQTATYPVLALVGGVVLFSEAVTVLRVVGAASIAGGIWALMGGGSTPGSPGSGPTTGLARRRRRWAYLLPVAGGLAFAASDLVRKLGVTEIPHPAFGAVIGTAAMMVVWAVMVFSVPRIRRQATLEDGWQWFLLTGLLAAFGVLSVFRALDAGDVSVVGPIIMAQPLIVVVLSAIFLRDLEKLTPRLVTGAVLTVLGVVLITIS